MRLIVVAGSLAQMPKRGGHAWVFLQYLLGLRRLGWDVLFLDALEPGMSVDENGETCPAERSNNWRFLRETMDSFGLGGRYALLHDRGSGCLGLSRAEIRKKLRNAALLINVMGYLDDPEVLDSVPQRVFLDIDPGFGQMWRELGLADMFSNHDQYVTIGENIGQDDCLIPTCGIDWITTSQPVVLDQWAVRMSDGSAFTSVGAWRGPYDPVEYKGEKYGLRAHEFRRFIELPRLSTQLFRLALDIHPADRADLDLLKANGWKLDDPFAIGSDTGSYRRYLQTSFAEFGVAKSMYVRTNSGWVSDRSICYLASGRPVLAQDTGFQHRYGGSTGLLSFSTLHDAIEAVEEVAGNYRHHSTAARQLAEEHFDSDKVLTRLLSELRVT